jgi:hypothetical protein
MGTHMKTTIEISDALLTAARGAAAKRRTTLRRLVEDGLRRVLTEQREAEGFQLRKVSFKGKGVQPPLVEGEWERIRDLVYDKHGA